MNLHTSHLSGLILDETLKLIRLGLVQRETVCPAYLILTVEQHIDHSRVFIPSSHIFHVHVQMLHVQRRQRSFTPDMKAFLFIV